jgi:hypothetical protein
VKNHHILPKPKITTFNKTAVRNVDLATSNILFLNNVLKISTGDYWCIQNNGWSIDSAIEIYRNNKRYHQLKKELRIRKT